MEPGRRTDSFTCKRDATRCSSFREGNRLQFLSDFDERVGLKKKNSSILEGALLPLMVSADFSGQECDAASTPSVSRPLAQPDTEIQAAKSEENDKLE